jgi:lysophospholipase L1-like esterase
MLVWEVLKNEQGATMKNRFGRVIAGGLLYAVITAGILEITVRVMRPIPDNVPMTYHAAAGDEDYAPDPEASVRSIFGIVHRTDSRGLRGPERPLARAPGRARVAVVGDSVVWGFGIPEEDTIAASLERLAQQRTLPLEAWNLGVQAYNTYNEKGKYARLAPLVRPDVTIVVVLFNDLQAKAEHFRITSAGTLADPRLRAPYPDAWRPGLEKSALFHAAIQLYWRLAPPGGGAFDLQNLPGVLRQLDEIRATARTVGSAFVVAAMPSAWPDPEHFAVLTDGLRQFCAERTIAFVDLSALLGRPVRRDYLLPADSVHPTAEGAGLIAEALWPAVEQALKRP